MTEIRSHRAERAVERLAARQWSVVARHQALDLGMSRQQIQRRLRLGRWIPLHPGVYALAGAPDSWERKVMAALLAAGAGAVASHETAAVLLNLAGARRRRIELTVVDTTPRRLHAVTVHRTQELGPRDVTEVEGLAVTSVARTVADLSGTWGLGPLARAVDDALVRNLVDRAALVEITHRLGPAPGRKISRPRLLVAERGAELERADSVPEARLVTLLNRSELPAAVQQHPVTVEGHDYVLDAAYPDQLVAIEYFGFDPHRTRRAFGHDHRRTRHLTAVGWTVLTFTRDDTNAEIIASVRQALSA